MSAAATPSKSNRNRPDPIQLSDSHLSRLQRRARLLRDAEIDFISCDAFRDSKSWDSRAVDDMVATAADRSSAPSDLPAHLRRICEAELLTHEQEAALFREMNYVKFCASELQSRLDPAAPDEALIQDLESLLDRAQRVRDHLIKANMRLVMSIVKKFVTPQQSYEELLSDGAMTLMRAVEKFDFGRGFRFSTYAYRSVARGAYRSMAAARSEEARFTRDAEQWAFEAVDEGSDSSMNERTWTHLRQLAAGMLQQLDRRERFIVRSRYALGAHRQVRTFQYLADRLGVSKERVRQLEQRAVKKMQAMATEFEPEELFGPALA